jgi:hypothetical protein
VSTLTPLEWTAYADDETVARRAAGRAHYNSVRRARAVERRRQLWCERRKLRAVGEVWGWQKRMARVFGVSPATICHDWRLIRLGKVW